MTTAAHRLPAGHAQFLIGRWFGEAGLDGWNADPPPNVGDDYWTTTDAVFHTVREELDAVTTAAFDHAEEGTPLEPFLRALGGQCIQKVSGGLNASAMRRAIDDCVDRLWQQTAADPFEAAFEAVRCASECFYQSCGFNVTDVRIRFDLGIVQGETVHQRVPPQVEAQTFGEQTGALVKVRFATGCFSKSEIRALPAMLFHELVVHAHASKDEVESDGSWAEGWMDCIAHRVHDLTMTRGMFGGPDPHAAAGSPDRLRQKAATLHEDRYRRCRAAMNHPSRLRLARDDAGKALAALTPQLRDRAVDAFHRFCVAINRGPLCQDERDAAAQLVGGHIRCGNSQTSDALVACATSLLDDVLTENERTQLAADFFASYI